MTLDSYITRVETDGGIIGDLAETTKVFDQIGTSNVVAGVGAAYGYKLENGFVTKLYDIIDEAFDQYPSPQATESIITDNMLTLAGPSHVNKPYFKSANGLTGGSSMGVVASFTLETPESGPSQMAGFEEAAAGTRRMYLQSAPDGVARYFGYGRYGAGTHANMFRKTVFTSDIMFGSIWGGATGHRLYMNGDCVQTHKNAVTTAYSSKTLYPAVSNVLSGLSGTIGFALYLKDATMLQQRRFYRIMVDG